MHNISSIQQVGLGSADVFKVSAWYREHLLMNVNVFSEEAEAALMTRYTGNKVQKRHAILSLNKNGGGGLEFWQFKSRNSEAHTFDIMPGDLGIGMLKMKVSNIGESYERLAKAGVKIYYGVGVNEIDPLSFAFRDPFGNDIQIIQSPSWYNTKSTFKQGGVLGVVIGVSNLEKSIEFYKNVLNFNLLRNLDTSEYEDLNLLAGSRHRYNRAILSHSEVRLGPFSHLLGANVIELIEVRDRRPKIIFKDRFWGDQGFIHLCFDVQGMSSLKEFCAEKDVLFTVDSADSFDMGKAAGRFAYIEDPDGTLIEFVETHKIPLIPAIGWHYKIDQKRIKNLPNWLIKLMFLSSK